MIKINIIKPINLMLPLAMAALILTACQNGKVLGEENSEVSAPAEVAGGQVAIIDYNIIISKPLENDVISSPMEYNGRTMITGQPILIRLVDSYKNVLATSTPTMAEGGSFSGQVNFPVAYSQSGWLEAYSLNTADNTVSNLIRVPVKYRDFIEPKVKVFFSNILKDPDLKDCGTVYPVERKIAPDRDMMEIILTELLNGVSEDEAKAGYLSNIPEEGIKVQKLSFENNKLTIDFNQALQQGVKGACRVAAIRAQITETLKQFQDVAEVVISIDGKTEGILRP